MTRMGKCVNCKEVKNLKTFKKPRLCYACHRWLWSKGESRPLRRYTKFCLNCHATGRLVKGRCFACAKYHQTHNHVERPKRLYEKSRRKCLNPNCRKPLGIGKSSGGRCGACRTWLNRTKEERPKERCVGSLGWCDCGKAAVKEIEVRLGSGRFTFDKLLLCEECLELESEMA